MVDLPVRPATDLRAAMEENLEQAHRDRALSQESGRGKPGHGRFAHLGHSPTCNGISERAGKMEYATWL